MTSLGQNWQKAKLHLIKNFSEKDCALTYYNSYYFAPITSPTMTDCLNEEQIFYVVVLQDKFILQCTAGDNISRQMC